MSHIKGFCINVFGCMRMTAEHNFGRGSPFHQSLVLSDQVVSEENILSNCVRMDDRRKVMTKAHLIPSKIVFGSPDLQPTWSLLLKIKKGDEIFKNLHL
jgi:hypothetical protein